MEELREGFEKRFRKSQQMEVKENEEEKRIRKSLENQQLNKEAMQFFGQNSTSIEVARLGEIERIQFMVLPYCHELPQVNHYFKVNSDSESYFRMRRKLSMKMWIGKIQRPKSKDLSKNLKN